VAEEPVSSEPVSGLKFPANRENNREFSKFEALGHAKSGNLLVDQRLGGKFPATLNREFFRHNKE
jgi:hypothetical protein